MKNVLRPLRTTVPAPAVTVAMSMRNASRFLRECIDSVLSQSFTDFEFLIVDDGSTDDSVDIVRSYSDPRIRLICRPHDFIASLNTLLDEARGRYIARMDADDIMLPHRLQEQVTYLDHHPDVDILGCGAVMFRESVNLDLTSATYKPIIPESVCRLTLSDFIKTNCLIHPSVIIRTSALIKYGYRYEADFIYAEDYRLWTRLIIAGAAIAKCETPCIAYRLSSHQVSSVHHKEQLRLSSIISDECENIAASNSNKDYSEPEISQSSNKLTIIIPFLNEGVEVANTVASIRRYAENTVDIIVINDHSYDGFDYMTALIPYDVIYIFNHKRLGVAASRDKGVELAKTPYFLLLDAHMRFFEGECFRYIEKLLESNDRQLLCCQSVGLIVDADSKELIPQQDYTTAYGAYISLRRDKYIPEVKWLQREQFPGAATEEIPAVLGAGYAASRRYWNYIFGLRGLKSWGYDEAYISYKVWLEGGRCLLLKNHTIGHLYRPLTPYRTDNADIVYNSLFISELMFPDRVLNWSHAVAMAHNMIVYYDAIKLLNQNAALITELRNRLKSISTRTFETVQALSSRLSSSTFSNKDNQIVNFDKEYDSYSANIEPADISLEHGLGAVILWKTAIGRNITTEFNTVAKIIFKEELSLPSGFGDGIAGTGWLIIYLVQRNLVPLGDSNRLIAEIDRHLMQIDISKLSLTDFYDGLGGLLCYMRARLWLDSFDEISASPLLDIDFIMRLRDAAFRLLHTAECDVRSYFNARQLLFALNIEEDDWKADVRDWLILNPKPEKEMPDVASLSKGLLGYSVMSKFYDRKSL